MKATVIKRLESRRLGLAQKAISAGAPLTRVPSRAASLYSNRTTFLQRAARKVGFGGKVHMGAEELQRFSSMQTYDTGQTLARHSSRVSVTEPPSAL